MEPFAEPDRIDKMLGLRDAAVSAAELGDFENCSSHFAEAAKIAIELQWKGMAAGLLADQAVSEFLGGNRESALRLAAEAVELYESLEGHEGRHPKNAHLILLANAILWMRQELGRSEYDGFVVVPGSCSEAAPHEELSDRPAPPFLLLWYQLAILEAELNVDVGVLPKLLKRSGSEVCVPYELELAEAQLMTSCLMPDHEKFVEFLCQYLALLNKAEEGQATEKMVLEKPSKAEHVLPEEWSKPKYYPTVLHAITAFCLGALASNSKAKFFELTVKLSELNQDEKVLRFLKRIGSQNESALGTRAETLIAENIFLCRTLEEKVTPLQAFNISFYFWSWFSGSPFRNSLGDTLEKLISSIWTRVLANCTDMLVEPAKNSSLIKEVLNNQATGFKKVGMLILAANNAIENGLPEEMQTEIRNSL